MLALIAEFLFGWLYRRTLHLPALGTERLWAIAAGANLARLNGSSLTSLRTTMLPATNRHILRQWWGVTDADGLRSMIGWLGREGHRAKFQQIHAALSPDPGAERPPDGLLGTPTASFIIRNHARFKNGDLVAWDLVRAINLARWGFSCGYLPESEAWEVLLAAAQGLAAEYDSWEELSDNYLLGFSYWQDGAEPDQFLAEAATWLKVDPASPWRTLPWSTAPRSG